MAKQIQSITDLIPDAANANKGTERGRYAVEASLRETGAGRSIVVDKDGRIIAGNKTLEAWADISGEIEIVKTDGKKLIVVQREDLDLSDVEGLARKLAYYDNRAGQLGLEWDAEQLFSDLNAGVDLSSMFFDDEIADILATINGYEKETAGEDPGADVSKADELQAKWNVQLGDLWQFGDHRLICGDCTDEATVSRVMGGEKALLLTDPPYGINLDSEWQNDVHKKQGKPLNHDTSKIANDKGEIKAEMFAGWQRRVVFGFPYLYDANATGWVVWDKEPGFESRSLTSPIEMAYATTWQGFKAVRLLWSGYMRESGSENKVGHPTQKPLRLISDILKWHDDEYVADLFLGSGTTIIACEQLGRKCRAVELHPPYVSVALERFFTMTGVKPVLLERI